jgi:outer membrane protein
LFNTVHAELNIAFIDMNKIIETSQPGASLIKQLNELNQINLKNFENEEKIIKENEETIIKQKNIISEKEFKANIEKLKLEINNYKKNRNKVINDFNQLKINNTNNLLKSINPILAKFSNEKSISIILQKKNLVIGKTELDITDEIIMIINENIKEFKIQ